MRGLHHALMMKHRAATHLWLSTILLAWAHLAFAHTNTLVNATLAWTASPGAVSGYRVYSGVASRTYTNVVDVGNATTATLGGLTLGVEYFFAVTSYDSTGMESDFSSEISYVAGAPPSTTVRTAMVLNSIHQAEIMGYGPVGYAYDLQASKDLKNWNSIGRVTNDATGFFEFTDPSSAVAPQRYYRLRQVAP